MLVIRFNRSGRANSAFFRIVVTENSKPTQSGFIKTLGWYNPHTKDSSINKEEILRYLDNGAQVSNSMAKLLTANKISHKLIKFVPDTPGKKKSEPKEAAKAPVSADGEDSQESPEIQIETPESESPSESNEPTVEEITEETPLEAAEETQEESPEATDEPANDDKPEEESEKK